MSNYNREYAQEYYKKNKERITERNREWQANNREKMREYSKSYKTADNPTYAAYNERNYEKLLWQSAKRNAEQSGIPFELELADIVIPEVCPFLEITLTKIRGAGRLETNASIDKIIPVLGYVKGNFQIISEKANRMKQNASIEELILFSKNVLKKYEQ